MRLAGITLGHIRRGIDLTEIIQPDNLMNSMIKAELLAD